MNTNTNLPQHVTIPFSEHLKLLKLWNAAEQALPFMRTTREVTLGELDKDPNAGDIQETKNLAACLRALGPVKPTL